MTAFRCRCACHDKVETWSSDHSGVLVLFIVRDVYCAYSRSLVDFCVDSVTSTWPVVLKGSRKETFSVKTWMPTVYSIYYMQISPAEQAQQHLVCSKISSAPSFGMHVQKHTRISIQVKKFLSSTSLSNAFKTYWLICSCIQEKHKHWFPFCYETCSVLKDQIPELQVEAEVLQAVHIVTTQICSVL